jgi:hypothetical protein
VTKPKYFRSVYQVEVLSARPYEPADNPDLTDLEAISQDITDGDCSGMVTEVVSNEEVSEERMRELLIAQGSDPGFLIPDHESEQE